MPEKRNYKKLYRYSEFLFRGKNILYSRIIGLEKMRIEISRFFEKRTEKKTLPEKMDLEVKRDEKEIRGNKAECIPAH